MKFDPGSADGKPVALLFPGQGTSRTLFSAIAGRNFEVIQKGEFISFFFR